MTKFYAILIGFTLFACSKKQEVIIPEDKTETPAPPPLVTESSQSTQQCTPNAIAPPVFRYDATFNFNIGGPTDTIFYSPAVQDYAPVIRDRVNALYWKGGGALYIAPGRYPVTSSTNFTFYPTDGVKKLAITGIPDAAGTLPTLFDTEISRTPHSFLHFSSTPNDHIEFYVSALAIEGNNTALSDTHPFFKKQGIYAIGIYMGNMKRSGVANVKISNMYGDGIMLYNWAHNFMTDYNIGDKSLITNCYLSNNWSDNGLYDSGDGIMLWHVNNTEISNTVISNNYTQQKKYGRGGIVVEAGTKRVIVKSSFIQGYRNGIICERDFGGHNFIGNTIFNNQISGISFAHDAAEVQAAGSSAYTPTKILNNTFEFHQTYKELGADLWSFIVFYTNSGYALSGMEISGNTFVAHEKNSPLGKDTWHTVGNPYNFYIKTDGQEGINISNNIYK